MHDGEEWRDIPGYAGYQASSEGRIRSIDRTVNFAATATHRAYARIARGRVLRPAAICGATGHSMVMCGRSKHLSVHVGVALAFHGPKVGNDEVRHLDGDPTNNRPQNLRWGSRSENNRDVTRHERRKLKIAQVHEIRSAVAAGESQTKVAARYGVNSGTVWRIANRTEYRDV